MVKAKTTKLVKQDRLILEVEKRKITGHKIKNLRKQGILPVNLYGKEIKSQSLQVEAKALTKLLSKVGETGLVDLKIKGLKKDRVVLLKNPQYDPVTDSLLHMDFHQVDLTKKVAVDVPVVLIGKAPAVDTGKGVLVQLLDEIEVQALPTDLPEKIFVDVSKLKEVNDMVVVGDLKLDKKVELKINKDEPIAKIDALMKEVEEEKPEEELVDATDLVEGEESKEPVASKQAGGQASDEEQDQKEETAKDNKTSEK